MSDRMVKNISNLQHALSVHVKGESMGKDVVVQLAAGEVFWCPDERDTKSLLVYTKKRFLELTNSVKPNGANYYEAYPSAHWNADVQTLEDSPVTIMDTNADEPEDKDEVVQRTKWDESDIDFLKKNYPKHGLTYCVDKLGRGRKAVKKKVETLGLKKDKSNDKE